MFQYTLLVPICSLIFLAAIHGVPQGRIVGGSPALPGQFPYQVSLELHGEHICGGTIISKYYILTAAHCLVNDENKHLKLTASTLTVEAGTAFRGRGGVRIPVAETIVHPSYMSGDRSVDIALVKLSKPLILSKTIQAIALSGQDVPDNSKAAISGWGRLFEGGEKPIQLQWLVAQILPKRICDLQLDGNTDKLLCLAHAKNTGVCFGDSGGPAVVDQRLVGIAKGAIAKCGGKQPDVYVKVSSYLDWIENNSYD